MQTNMSEATPTAPQTPPANATAGTGEIDDFIYLISHDVRASVRALLELPQWIKEDLEEAGISTDGQVGSSIDLMNRHTGRLDRMLMDLLSYSRVGRMQAVQLQHIPTVLEDVLEQMAIPAGFKVTQDVQCDTIMFGERDLPLLFSALISNAIKHHTATEGQIHIAIEKSSENIILTVSDDGPGIEEKFYDRVFSPMTTLRPRDEVEGSGMGLANVQKIARHYAGQARIVPSVFGRGTCIEVTLRGPRVS